MNVFKIILALVVLVLAALGAFAVFGIVAALFKYILFFGAVLLVGAVAYKALKKGGDRADYQLAEPEDDFARADRLLEEMRRKQLTK